MARSWVRLYYNETSYYDYENVWDINIDPQAVVGAELFRQEGRKATFSLYLDEIWLSGGLHNYFNNELRWIRRVWVEIWDTPFGSDNPRVVFAGFLLNDSVEFSITQTYFPGTSTTYTLRPGTVTVYDWTGVFIRINEGQSITIPVGLYVIQDNLFSLLNPYLQQVWPFNQTSVGYQVNTYPDFGVIFNNERIWLADGRYQYIIARLYLDNTGYPSMQVYRWKIDTNSWIHNDTTYYNRYLTSILDTYHITGTYLDLQTSINNSENQLWSIDPEAPEYWGTTAQLGYLGISPSEWALQQTLSIEGATYNIVAQTNNMRLNLTLSGIATRTNLTITEEFDINKLDWVNYLLNVQYASLTQIGFNTTDYLVTNRGFHPFVTTWDFDAEGSKYFKVDIKYDSFIEPFTFEPENVSEAKIICKQVNEYVARSLFTRKRKIFVTTDNLLAYPSQAINIPSLGITQMYVISKEYDVNTKLFTYEGRV